MKVIRTPNDFKFKVNSIVMVILFLVWRCVYFCDKINIMSAVVSAQTIQQITIYAYSMSFQYLTR